MDFVSLQARRFLWPWCSWVSVVIWSYESFGVSLDIRLESVVCMYLCIKFMFSLFRLSKISVINWMM
jgi:hypothetical protein